MASTANSFFGGGKTDTRRMPAATIPESPVQRILANSGLILAARGTAISVNLVTVPVILRASGVEGFANWETLLGITALLATLQYVTRSTMAWLFGSQAPNGSPERAAWSRAASTFALAVAALALVAVILLRASLLRLLLPNLVGAPHAVWIIPLTVIPFAVAAWNDIHAASLIADHRSGTVACLQTLAMIVQAITAIVSLRLHCGIWSLPIAQTLSAAGLFVMNGHLARRNDPGISILPGRIGRRAMLMFAGYAKYLLVGTVCSAMRGSLDRLFIASTGNLAFLTSYGIAARLATIVNELTNLIYVPATAAAAQVSRKGDPTELTRLHGTLTAYLVWLLVPCIAVLVPTVETLVRLWTGKNLDHLHLILAPLVISASMASLMTGPATAILKGCGNPRPESHYLLVTLGLNLLILYPCVALFHAYGTMVASTASWMAGSIHFAIFSLPKARYPAVPSLRFLLWSLLAFAAPFALHLAVRPIVGGLGRPWETVAIAVELAVGLVLALCLARQLAPPPEALVGLRRRLWGGQRPVASETTTRSAGP